jgi:Flp pilus assembly protein TadD
VSFFCPVCRTENTDAATSCASCGAPVLAYARLLGLPAGLFNEGLAAARGGELVRARDCFAAVVLWCPLDSEARNAHAMACLALGDADEARSQWMIVLERQPDDAVALRGIAGLDGPAPAPA